MMQRWRGSGVRIVMLIGLVLFAGCCWVVVVQGQHAMLWLTFSRFFSRPGNQAALI
jgi:hypothetical protein